MRIQLDGIRRATPFLSGLLIGTALVTPVFAATEVAPDRIQPWLLGASVLVLVIALALQAMATHKSRRDRKPERTVALRQADNEDGYGAVGDGLFIARHATGTIGDFRVAPRWR